MVVDFVDVNQVIAQCATSVHPQVMHGIIATESSYNPFAIGVVKGKLQRQPRSLAEAVATVKMLEAQGKNYSMGLAQINKINLKPQGLDYKTVFDPCNNLRASANIFNACHTSAKSKFADPKQALNAAFSCYYSGNFKTGFTRDLKGQPSYVQKVNNSMTRYGASATKTVMYRSGNSGVAIPAVLTTTSDTPAAHAAKPFLIDASYTTQKTQKTGSLLF